MTDEALIRQTLKLAAKGRGRVSPNPMVGAVIMKDDEIVGVGYHREFGAEHAEVAALQSVTSEASGATLYVNLEPCVHVGKQPPCVEAIVAAGIRRVVVGTRDPNPLVNGRGIEQLSAAGVEVASGVLERECQELNAAFFKFMTRGLPLVTLKIAQTLDGKIAAANGSSKWITSERSRRLVHRMRSQSDAVLVGIGTVLSDNPSLNVRLVRGRNPKRIVLDSRLRIPLTAELLNDALADQTIIATTGQAAEKRVKEIKNKGAEVWQISSNGQGRVDLRSLCRELAKAGIASVLVEGGGEVFSAFLRDRLADRAAIFVAPKILGAGVAATHDLEIASLEQSIELRDVRRRKIDEDLLLMGRIEHN